jgi:hypothetical protein
MQGAGKTENRKQETENREQGTETINFEKGKGLF